MIVKIEGVPEFNLKLVETIEFTKRLGRYCMDFSWIDSIIENDNEAPTLIINSIPIFFTCRNTRKNAYLRLMHAKAKNEPIFAMSRKKLIEPYVLNIRHQSPQSDY